MGAMRRIGVAERRPRLGQRHRLVAAARAGDPLDVAHALVALTARTRAPTLVEQELAG